MKEETISAIYLNVYFGLLLAVQTLLIIYQHELDSPKGIVNTVLNYMAFVPFYGYVYDKKILSKYFWLIFAFVYFLWELGRYFFLYNDSFKIDIMLFIMLAPLYWGVIMYVLITMEEDDVKKALMVTRRNNFKEKFKSLFAICNVLALLFLILCLIVMISK